MLKEYMEGAQKDLLNELCEDHENHNYTVDFEKVHDHFADVLDVEYRLNSRLDYVASYIYITLGGPNIWIDTYKAEICGAWGSERESLPIPYSVRDAIDDCVGEWYECQRG